MLTNARAFVVEDAVIGEAFDDAARLIEALQEASVLEEARVSALGAVDALERSLACARPNADAKALGVDWF